MKIYSFDTTDILTITETSETGEVLTVQSITKEQLAANLPAIFMDMPLDIMVKAQSVVKSLAK